jgi:hypothetical protein
MGFGEGSGDVNKKGDVIRGGTKMRREGSIIRESGAEFMKALSTTCS